MGNEVTGDRNSDPLLHAHTAHPSPSFLSSHLPVLPSVLTTSSSFTGGHPGFSLELTSSSNFFPDRLQSNARLCSALNSKAGPNPFPVTSKSFPITSVITCPLKSKLNCPRTRPITFCMASSALPLLITTLPTSSQICPFLSLELFNGSFPA